MHDRSDARMEGVAFHFERPADIPSGILERIESLVGQGGAVGSSFVKENLRNAFLIAYAVDSNGEVIGTVTLKRQKDSYRRKLEAATGLDLSGCLERGYTSVAEPWKGRGIGGRLIEGLIRKAPDQRVYVTIRMDNRPALELTRKNGMVLAATFHHERTGRDIGLFTNRVWWTNP